jgi:ATP-dependent helicase Lhr and Lhr-like helicase
MITPNPSTDQGNTEIMNGKNVLLTAPTGLGKTEAALLPLLDRLLKIKRQDISAIYITPLRALSRNLLRRRGILERETCFTAQVRHGGAPQKDRERQLYKELFEAKLKFLNKVILG